MVNRCYVYLFFDLAIFVDNSLWFFSFRAQGIKSMHHYRDY